jgi:hypothetical protein
MDTLSIFQARAIEFMQVKYVYNANPLYNMAIFIPFQNGYHRYMKIMKNTDYI